ncbi:redox-sensing transcriptional repressor Rex [Christensenellaceae bacterium OttesenSCG-928-M15]|nr:redox-sensing transcriptional repressor Rex [Christensenellaceae bacterium OttesenSCG-928-M15]
MTGQLSINALRRLPRYLNYLNTLPLDVSHISATQIAAAIGLHDVQVRKDLAAISGSGKPKTGYVTSHLIDDIKALMKAGGAVRFCIVGAGHLGMALMQYGGFLEYGLVLTAVFDDIQAGMSPSSGMDILPLSSLKSVCSAQMIEVGIICTRGENAQEVFDLLVDANVKTIWNFAPVHLQTPENVTLAYENMAASLAILCQDVKKKTG